MSDTLCATCKQPTQPTNIITCPACKNHYHKVAHCVTATATDLKEGESCPACHQKKARILERSCPHCQKHLWSFHLECGKIFGEKLE
ncbi:hypothetical protein HYV44_03160 [Candidatus Microgenomates bacterium]|nr:hypothetical protein [Candidatus Microgenomates bacterium]